MRLHKLLTVTGAVVAAGALALAPTAAQASHTPGPIHKIDVTGVGTGNVVTPLTEVILKSASVVIPVYGSPTTLNCTAGTAAGSINGGTLGVPTNPVIAFSSLNLTCDSFLPGSAVTMTATCPVNYVLNNQTVNTAKTDILTGKLQVRNCVRIDVAGGCRLTIGGDADATYNENKKTVGSNTYSDLTLSGNGLTTDNPNILCLGAVSNGGNFTLNAVFNTRTNFNAIPDPCLNHTPCP